MSTVLTSTSIRLEIQKIKELPPLPVIAQQLLAAINKDDTSIDEIAKVIQSDPILTSRILGLANSAFFGFGRSLYNLTEAIVNVLGLDMVKALGLTMVMGGVFDVRKCSQFDIVRHWSHAFMTAELSMRMLPLVRIEEKVQENQLFLYGLLHNFGILILVNKFPDNARNGVLDSLSQQLNTFYFCIGHRQCKLLTTHSSQNIPLSGLF